MVISETLHEISPQRALQNVDHYLQPNFIFGTLWGEGGGMNTCSVYITALRVCSPSNSMTFDFCISNTKHTGYG